MHISHWLTGLVAVVVLVVVIVLGSMVLQPPGPLLAAASFDDDGITPNADGDNDLTTFHYTLTGNATVTMSLTNVDGQTFTFREKQERVADDYNVLFNGIVDGYVLPDEVVHGDIERRLIPEGDYTWTITAEGEDGESESLSGSLFVTDADSALPDISGFHFRHAPLTPNQDGLADRANIVVYVEKDADLTVFLLNEEGAREYITERNEGVNYGDAGAHTFDYDGGIDAGQEPPPDGDYTMVVIAQDAVGQRVRREDTLTIGEGGTPGERDIPTTHRHDRFYDTMPYVESYFTEFENPGDLIAIPEGIESIITDSEVVLQGDMLVFRLTVTNDGSVGLRTTGPRPGTVYQQDQRASSIGWFDQSGAFRVGLECDTAKTSYPWRWAIGSPEDLVEVQEDGETYYYLPPGESAVVWGGVRLTEIMTQRNPQPCWIGLIHEDVAVVQADVDRRWVEIQEAPASE